MDGNDPRRPIILLMITGALILLAGFTALMFAIKKKLNEAEEFETAISADAPALPEDYRVRDIVIAGDERAILHVSAGNGAGNEIYILNLLTGTILSRLPEADDPAPDAVPAE
ncbi:MAG: hypothetical protein Alpg2KO_29410 [Alphaproteobacteria bacterium]